MITKVMNLRKDDPPSWLQSSTLIKLRSTPDPGFQSQMKDQDSKHGIILVVTSQHPGWGGQFQGKTQQVCGWTTHLQNSFFKMASSSPHFLGRKIESRTRWAPTSYYCLFLTPLIQVMPPVTVPIFEAIYEGFLTPSITSRGPPCITLKEKHLLRRCQGPTVRKAAWTMGSITDTGPTTQDF